MDRHAANHYPIMSLEALAELKLPAAKDCVLYLWTTIPMLANAMTLISGWRFTYKSLHAWPKPDLGTGHWNRENLELLLIATKGAAVAPAHGTQERAWIEAERGAELAGEPGSVAPAPTQPQMVSRRAKLGGIEALVG